MGKRVEKVGKCLLDKQEKCETLVLFSLPFIPMVKKGAFLAVSL